MLFMNLYFNQYANGGAIESECWSTVNGNTVDRNGWGSCSALRTIEIEVPDDWSLRCDAYGKLTVYDSSNTEVVFYGDYNKCCAADIKNPRGRIIWEG